MHLKVGRCGRVVKAVGKWGHDTLRGREALKVSQQYLPVVTAIGAKGQGDRSFVGAIIAARMAARLPSK